MAHEERIKILTQAEESDLYGPPIFNEDEQRYFFSLNDPEIRSIRRLNNRESQCMCIVLLGYFKSKPVTIQPKYHTIKHDIQYVADNILPGKRFRPFNLSSKSISRLYQKIFNLIDYQRFSMKVHSPGLINHLAQQANSWVYPRSIFDAAIEYLSLRRIAIPGYSTLQKLISLVINNYLANIHEKINKNCSDTLTDALRKLALGEGPVTIKSLGCCARNFNSSQLKKEITAYDNIHPWMTEITNILEGLSLSHKNEQHYAERINYYGAKLKLLSTNKQRLYLLCYLHSRYQKSLERIAEGFIHHVRQAKLRAKKAAKEHLYQNWQKIERNVPKAANVLRLFMDDTIDPKTSFYTVQQRAFRMLNVEDLTAVCQYLGNQPQSLEERFWCQLDQESSLRTGLLRSLFCCLRFEGTDNTKRLTTIIHQSQRDISEHRGLTEASIDQRFPPKKVRSQIINESDEVNINRFEWFLYLQIPDRLNGQLLLTDVIKYRSLDADLVAKGTWTVEQKQLLENTQQPKLLANPKHYIPEIVDELHVRMQAVGNYLNQSDNKGVILRQKGKGYHWRLPTAYKKHTVNNPFFQQMRKIDLIDVLRVVDQDTGFIDEFKHVLGMSSKSRLYETDLLAILIANGTNQGIYGMAQISDRSYNQLSRIQANYFRLETLNSANDKINNATINLPIFKHYNIKEDSVHASIDGQKFESRRETFRTRYSSKYFGTGKGVSSVSLNINHLVAEAKIIGSNDHESHYIYDLLKNNNTELDPDTVSTDTHGTNHVNFALLDLFGYRFAPRYAKVGKVINGLFNITEDQNGDIQLTLKKPIKTNIIVKHWDTIQRIAVSLDQCKTTQATLVRKLSGYKSNHPLLEALTEYNRLLKALYLLRYIDDEDLRNHVQRALNRGEAYHQLRRAISSVNGDKFRGNSDEEIQIWNECARLLANAIIYFNSKVLSHLLTSFEQQGKSRQLAIIKNASPVAWENINFRGTYKFSEVDELPILEELMATIEGYEPTEFE